MILILFHIHKTTTEYEHCSAYLQTVQKGDGSIRIECHPQLLFPTMLSVLGKRAFLFKPLLGMVKQESVCCCFSSAVSLNTIAYMLACIH